MGVVGAGYVSQYHVRALRTLPFVELVAIADADLPRARQVADANHIPLAVSRLEEMAPLAPDVVHVLTPPASHCSLALQALAMGCHVLVEKPMASTVEECDRMMGKARSVQRVLSVNHSAKFDPLVQKAIALAGREGLGDILHVTYFRSSDYPPYTGGALPPYYSQGGYPFRDLGVHGLYLLEAFLGPIQNVDTHYRSTGLQANLMFDEWQATVACQKGVGEMQISWNTRPMLNTLILQGTGGVLELDLSLQRWRFSRQLPGPKAASLILNALAGACRDLWQVPWNTFRFASGRLLPSPDIHAAVRQFYFSLRQDGGAAVVPEEGRRAVYWVEDAARRADADRTVTLALGEVPKPARILVTGASGFLGRALVRRLAGSGQAVRVLLRRPSRTPLPEGVSPLYGDLGDPAAVNRAVAGVEVVYHVGAAMNGGWEQFHAGTVLGTRNVVEACLLHAVGKLIHVSSMSVLDYTRMHHGIPIDEAWPVEPFPEKRGFYAKSKLEAERIVESAVRDRGLNAVILRPGQIFGPGAEHVPPYGTIGVGRRWVVMGSGGALVPLVFVEDVVDALLQAAVVHALPGSLYHIVDPTEITQKQYVAFAKNRDRARPVTAAPMWFLYAAAAGLAILGRILRRSVPLTFYRLRSLPSSLRFDCSAAARDLAWTPHVGASAGLRLTYSGEPDPVCDKNTASLAIS